jgi:hypothetical protein
VKVLYSTSFEDDHKLTIFSPETLYINPLIRERIDSFSISVPGNIFWTDTVVGNDSFPFDQSYQFFISIKDTGTNEIIITTYLSNTHLNKTIKDQIYTVSPLSEEPVVIYLGNYCTLSTPGVRGEDVLYNWSFGDNFNISTKNPLHIILLNNTPPHSDNCSLWVSDTTGVHKSPKVAFQTTFYDTIPPSIIYINHMGLFNNDTIYYGENSFIFITEIYDQGNSAVEKTWINGLPFEYCKLSKNLYWNKFDNSPTESDNGPRQITIKAADQYANLTTKNFWLCFDSTLEKNNIAFLVVDNPDSESVTDNDHRITGKVYNFSEDSLLLNNVVNGTDSIYKSYLIAPDSQEVAWKWNAALKEGYNHFIIRLQKMSDKSVIIEKTLSIFLSTEVIDTVSPTITSIMINDSIPYTGSEMFFHEDTVSISVIAVDGISEVDKIFIDTVELFYKVQQQHWSNTVILSHDTKLKKLLSVYDLLSNKTTRYLNIFQNTKPKLLKNSLSQPLLFTGRVYHDSISLIDMENDPLTVTYLKKGPWETNGIYLYLKPTYNDTGQGSIEFTVSDGLQNSDTSIWYYDVTVPEEPVSVEFDSIMAESLFDTIDAGSNQTSINLSAKKGILPYHYTILLSPNDTVILDTSADSTLVWIPSFQDTGSYTLYFYVEDINHTKDTLLHDIYVRPTYPEITELAMTVTPDTVPVICDTVDATNLIDNSQITLNFLINPVSRGMFGVKVYSQDSLVDEFEIDNNKFSIDKLIQKSISQETIVVKVTDFWNNYRKKTIFLKHSNPIDTSIAGILPSDVPGCVWFDASDPQTVIDKYGNVCDQMGEKVLKWKSRSPRDSIELVSQYSQEKESYFPEYVVNPPAIYFNPQNQTYMKANRDGNFIKNDHHIITITLLDNNYDNMFFSIISFTDESYEQTYHMGYSHFFESDLDVTFFSWYGDPERINKRFRLYPSKGEYNIINATYSQSAEKYSFSLNSKQSTESISCKLSHKDWKYIQVGATDKHDKIKYEFHGNIAEIIVIPRILPADTLKGIEEYLADKYGIILNP